MQDGEALTLIGVGASSSSIVEASQYSGEAVVYEVKIKCIDESTTLVDVRSDLRGVDLKSLISEVLETPVERQRLLFRGRVMKDEDVVGQYVTENGQTVHMVQQRGPESSSNSDNSVYRPGPLRGQGHAPNSTTEVDRPLDLPPIQPHRSLDIDVAGAMRSALAQDNRDLHNTRTSFLQDVDSQVITFELPETLAAEITSWFRSRPPPETPPEPSARLVLPWHDLWRLNQQLARLQEPSSNDRPLPPAAMGSSDIDAFLIGLLGATAQLSVAIGDFQNSPNFREPRHRMEFAMAVVAASRMLHRMATILQNTAEITLRLREILARSPLLRSEDED